ncbi:thiamine pyrophosphate-dependent dehydrogenase E1 component subunit alpha [Bacillus sp. B15-48]|uniref:thiamine pyrophosphate-dependent dehydrogenase E1 component subunit alpha n=1 Tax=Bacillus sp. B15-48 TaxID=1548601 RepID=UPI00194011D8|nr:thiamine pyrophosphate-dependent dehydrogenase E1 component subunit alpha [Bacillus sp. B15-48]MBM4763848.1 pyruvate dehydrogenase (acetyl-transferring) E1 component subunit alpha [Bacillus sp. B15-48]
MALSKEEKMRLLHDMLLIRRFDERGAELVNQGELYGEVHQYIGEEAVAVGISSVLKQEDGITSNHRGHGHVIAKGGDINKMMAELGGKVTGYCKGKGGSMHITSLDLGIYGTNGMVGQGVPIALGAAFANHYKKNDQVIVTYFGDGASNEGAVFESMNMAALWKLPLIFVCENNQYAVSTSIKDSTPVENIADRARGFGMPAVIVDGMDVLAVHEAAKDAVERARRGEGPTFIEAKTYRYFGHFSGEAHILAEPYRSDEEINSYREQDPIERFKQHLFEIGMTEEEYIQVVAEASETIENGISYMKDSPYPDPLEAYDDAYAVIHETMPVKGWA